jgi:hypothetical protein
MHVLSIYAAAHPFSQARRRCPCFPKCRKSKGQSIAIGKKIGVSDMCAYDMKNKQRSFGDRHEDGLPVIAAADYLVNHGGVPILRQTDFIFRQTD